ncbi:hypothetical protein RhiirC2_857297 [Rhizophagus irregularis]|uniref:Uncharacterized protein n=1 Tax=Rhizophagus irregularis TaxID=588596 RepID=A0A2N1MD83_9GLOM|nr:hypothetical protein RhiirC2_857297 [Rhizophagus irregularis]
MPYDPDDDEKKNESRVSHLQYQVQHKTCSLSIMTSPRNFTDFSGMITKPSSSDAPRWRYYEPGLNIEGYCKNPSCAAYNSSRVIKPLGFRVFKFCIDSYLCKCPLCGCKFNEETCGFYKTRFRYYGYQEGNSNEFDSGWTTASNTGYTTFDSSDKHLVPWRQLTIEAIDDSCTII